MFYGKAKVDWGRRKWTWKTCNSLSKNQNLDDQKKMACFGFCASSWLIQGQGLFLILFWPRLQHDCSKGLIVLPQIRKWSGRKKFFKVREKPGIYILGQGKLKFWRKVRELKYSLLQHCWFNITEGWQKYFRSRCSQQCFYLMKKIPVKNWPVLVKQQTGIEATTIYYVAFYIYLVRKILFLTEKSQGMLRTKAVETMHNSLDALHAYNDVSHRLAMHAKSNSFFFFHTKCYCSDWLKFKNVWQSRLLWL